TNGTQFPPRSEFVVQCSGWCTSPTKWIMKRNASAFFLPLALLLRTSTCSAIALVTHPSVGQNPGTWSREAPRGVSRECQPAVLAPLDVLRTSSAHVEASAKRVSPCDLQKR